MMIVETGGVETGVENETKAETGKRGIGVANETKVETGQGEGAWRDNGASSSPLEGEMGRWSWYADVGKSSALGRVQLGYLLGMLVKVLSATATDSVASTTGVTWSSVCMRGLM